MASDAELTRSEFAQELGPNLTGEERQELKSLGHDIDPVVWVGDRGVSEGLIENFENQVEAHELIKVKVHDDGMVRPAARELREATDAQLVQTIGNNLLFYRRHPENPQLLESS